MDMMGRIVRPLTRAQIEAEAAAVRGYLGLEPHSRVSMLPLLEHVLDEAIPDFEFRVVENGHLGAADAVTDTVRPIIAMTDRTYRRLRNGDGWARMTAAHELGHLMLHCGMPHLYAHGGHNDPLTCPERQADIFAAAFLMPANAFRYIRSLAEARDRFGVSTSAAICRARHVGVRLDHPNATRDFHRRQLQRMFAPIKKKKERKP